MALHEVHIHRTPEYHAFTTDIVANKITGLEIVGAKVYIIDDNYKCYIVKPDYTLSPYSDTQNPTPQTFTFHNAVSATGNGNVFTVGSYKTMTLSGKGTSTTRTVEFHGIDANGIDDLINGFDNNFAQATGFTVNNKTWQVTIEGYVSFYCKITAIAGGNETIVGEATV